MPAAILNDSQVASQHASSELEARIARDPGAFRMLSGDRPTGPLHIGHYLGSVQNRVRLQDAGVDVLVVIADYQAMTDRTLPASLPETVTGLVATTWPWASTRPGR